MASGPHRQNLPTLFLDVDGVLNAFDFDPSTATFGDFEDHEVTVDQGNGFRIVLDLCLSRSMGKRLGALSAEIFWVTTWEHQADSIIAPLCDLPPHLGVLSRPTETTRSDGGWKFDEVRRAVGEKMKPFVWIDDDIDIFRSAAESARQWAANLPVRNLLISPDSRSGLTHGQLEAVEDFLLSVV